MWPRWYRPPQPRFVDIVDRVARYYGYQADELRSVRRDAGIVEARWVAAKALSTRAGLSYPSIGRILRKDHTTIIHAVRNFEQKARYRPRMHDALLFALVAA